MCVYVRVCVCLTQLNYKRITYLKCLSFYGSKQAVSLRLFTVSESMYVCKAHPCCCYLTIVESYWRECVAAAKKLCEKRKSVWKRRIYRKYASWKRLQTQDENLCADVVLRMSRGSHGQWFPETEYVCVRHLCCGNKWHTTHIKL